MKNEMVTFCQYLSALLIVVGATMFYIAGPDYERVSFTIEDAKYRGAGSLVLAGLGVLLYIRGC